MARSEDGSDLSKSAQEPQKWGEGEEEQKEQSRSNRPSLCRPLGKAAQTVAFAIASFGPICFASWGTLAARAGLSQKETNDGARELRARGLVEIIPASGDADRKSPTWVLKPLLRQVLGLDVAVDDAPPPAAPAAPEETTEQQIAALQKQVAELRDEALRGWHQAAQVREEMESRADEAPAPQDGPVREVIAPAHLDPPGCCPALRADETCDGTWHHYGEGRGTSYRCPTHHAAPYKVTTAPEAPPAARPRPVRAARTPVEHRREAEARRRRRAGGEEIYREGTVILVGPKRLADLDAIAERARDDTGAWSIIVGYLFPTAQAAEAACKMVT